VVEAIKKRFRVDEDRVYLTGFSMGGAGAYRLGLTRPSFWAAVLAVCPVDSLDYLELAPNALNLPIKIAHGDRDVIAPVTDSREWHKTLLRMGGPVEYSEYAGGRHNAWDYAYKDASAFAWLGQHKRNRYPARVRFHTRYFRYDTAYWVRMDALTPGEPAAIDAQFRRGNQITVATRNLDGFTLDVARHPMRDARRPLQVMIDDQPLRSTAAAASKVLSFRKAAGKWRLGPYQPQPGEKRKGAEGPVLAAVSGKHVYVYGTRAPAGVAELEKRRYQAEEAAQWARMPSLVVHSPVVVTDTLFEAAPPAAATNLVLFGTRETNSVIAQLAARLPVELNPGAADYGLLLNVSLDDRYVLVNSGREWWAGAPWTARPVRANLSAPYRTLLDLPDFVLFKGTLDNVIASGYLDKHWKVPEEAARKMAATGAVRFPR
jgi:hypothetical protein